MASGHGAGPVAVVAGVTLRQRHRGGPANAGCLHHLRSARRALFFGALQGACRPIDERHPRADLRQLEGELLDRVNELGIGPQGLGGRVTALGVNIEVFPTHIAGLPVAVNLGCHSTRRISATL